MARTTPAQAHILHFDFNHETYLERNCGIPLVVANVRVLGLTKIDVVSSLL